MARNRPVLITENINVDRDGAIVEFAIWLLSDPAGADRFRTMKVLANA